MLKHLDTYVYVICKAFPSFAGQSIDATQELLALSISNILGSFVYGFPVTASFGRTAINKASGVQTPLAGAVTGLMVMSALLFLMPFWAYIPRATLAAVVITAVAFNLEFAMVLKLWKFDRWEVFPWLITFLGGVLWRLEYGIILGIFFNLCQLLNVARKPLIQFTERVRNLVENLQAKTNATLIVYLF